MTRHPVTQALLESLCAFLWPARCIGCDAPVAEPVLCPACVLALPGAEKPVVLDDDGPLVYAPYRYEALVRDLMVRWKFGRDVVAGVVLARLLADAIPDAFAAGADIVVPVPSTWWRRTRRGVDPAGTLARAVARRLDLPVRRWLLRERTPPQTALSGARRRRNLAGAFLPGPVWGRSVLLVDDVVTTGTTAREAARALVLRGDAADVRVAALCRVRDPFAP